MHVITLALYPCFSVVSPSVYFLGPHNLLLSLVQLFPCFFIVLLSCFRASCEDLGAVVSVSLMMISVCCISRCKRKRTINHLGTDLLSQPIPAHIYIAMSLARSSSVILITVLERARLVWTSLAAKFTECTWSLEASFLTL